MLLPNKYGLKKSRDFIMSKGHVVLLGGKGVKVRIAA
jgi:hypothetical protein